MFEWLLSFFAFALVMSGSPGPNNVMVTASGATFGYRRTIPHLLGITLGFPAMLLALQAGMAPVFELYPAAVDVLKLFGAAWLLWLAWKIATASPTEETDGQSRSRPMTLIEGALFQWVNPKAWVIVLGALTAYSRPDLGLVEQVAIMSGIFIITCFFSTSIWTLTGAAIGRLLNSPRNLRIFNSLMAGLLVLSLVSTFVIE